MADEIMKFGVQYSIKDLLALVDDMTEDQLPFALSRALFMSAKEAKEKDMRTELYKLFTIRTRPPWAERAMFIFPKTMNELRRKIKAGEQPEITLQTRSELGRLLTDGGELRTKNGEDVAIPVLGGARKNKGTIIRPGRNSPADIIAKGGFHIPLKKGGRLLMLRTEKRGKGGSKLKAMFIRKPFVTIKPWWNLRDILAKAMVRALPGHFVEGCKIAMETRK